MIPLSVSRGAVSPQPLVDPRLGEEFAIFVRETNDLVRHTTWDEAELCRRIKTRLLPLLKSTAWIPNELMLPSSGTYRRECLYEAPEGAFSIGVFTWVPGHMSRIHDHHAWSVLGNITGVLRSENFLALNPGEAFKHADDDFLPSGTACWSTKATGDIHRISVASDTVSTSIHVYGCRFDVVNRDYYTEL